MNLWFAVSEFVCLPNSTPCDVVVEGVVSVTPEDDRLRRDHAHVSHEAGELDGALRLVVLFENRVTVLLHNQHLGGCGIEKKQKFSHPHFVFMKMGFDGNWWERLIPKLC
jgi:hypothetical protein